MTRTNEKTVVGPVFGDDGYEDAPDDVSEAIKTGPRLTSNSLPVPSELVFKTSKQVTTIRLDADVLAWFKSMGKGYQTKINAVLKAYKGSHQ